eukprot:jgi/Psemu1/306160/fgenesh1_kg.239_\
MSLVAKFVFTVDDDPTPKSGQPSGKDAQQRPHWRHSLYIGGKADAKDYDKLLYGWKISHILNVTPAKETNIEAGVPNYFENKGRIHYLRIPIYDAPTSVADLGSKYEKTIVQFIAKGLCHGNVLVHCSRGVSRSTTSVILYLMAKQGYGYEGALELIRRRRPQACPIPAFETWLRGREDKYRNEASENDAGGGKNKKRKKNPDNGAASTTAIGPSLPPKTVGPELPQATTRVTTKENADTATSTTTAASIGPSLPPTNNIGPEPPPVGATETKEK